MKNIIKTILKPIGKIVSAIRDMDKFWRFMLTWILCCAAFLLINQSDYSEMMAKEKNYEELTQAVHFMSQNHTTENLPYENISTYKVTFKRDKTIDIYLVHEGSETITATLNEEYEVIKLERTNDNAFTIFFIIVTTVFVGLATAAIIHLLFWLGAKIFALFLIMCLL